MHGPMNVKFSVKQLVLCNVDLQLHEPSALIPDTGKIGTPSFKKLKLLA